jgi:hypothetical protein
MTLLTYIKIINDILISTELVYYTTLTVKGLEVYIDGLYCTIPFGDIIDDVFGDIEPVSKALFILSVQNKLENERIKHLH